MTRSRHAARVMRSKVRTNEFLIGPKIDFFRFFLARGDNPNHHRRFGEISSATLEFIGVFHGANCQHSLNFASHERCYWSKSHWWDLIGEYSLQ